MITSLKFLRLIIQLLGTILILVGGTILTGGIMGLGYYGLKTGTVRFIGPVPLLVITIILSKKFIFPGLRKFVAWLLYRIDCSIVKHTKISHPRYFY
ncbi:hypothetical protein ABIB50_005417 [Mucilaginibacter sp. UYCu711]